ncbi:hypothetical protein FJQ54_13905 [Sandaracinobacter neustonicus]|uniref:Uncharacterized protein n=1 Tax=Sandaracinobacter neustonicus TaxID=1715348 RepID=A0A501XGY8_9SPHN|nr:hypothetical protein [Sandaracinobacter neustonicus]TPE59567.1 hypothetical protein FJQ54_13905 [Sandaracinobacter neustonicus]
MNTVASQWETADSRRQRYTREALERLLVREDQLHHGRATDVLRQVTLRDTSYATRVGLLAGERVRVQRIASAMAAGGALVAVLMIVFVVMAHLPLMDQALLITAAGLSVAMFRLVVQPGRPVLGTQMVLQLLMTLFLIIGLGAQPFGAAVALLGWAAALGRGWVETRTRAIDIAEMELAMKVRGADASRADALRRQAARI